MRSYQTSLELGEPLDAGRGIDAASLIEPAIVLPEQIESLRSRTLGGARALMLAVLEEAILCIQGGGRCIRSGGSREADRARRWVRSPDRSWLFSFENVCAALEIDPDCLRASLLTDGSRGRLVPAGALRHRVLRGRARGRRS